MVWSPWRLPARGSYARVAGGGTLWACWPIASSAAISPRNSPTPPFPSVDSPACGDDDIACSRAAVMAGSGESQAIRECA